MIVIAFVRAYVCEHASHLYKNNNNFSQKDNKSGTNASLTYGSCMLGLECLLLFIHAHQSPCK